MSKTIAAGVFLVRKNGTVLVCHPTNHSPEFWSIPKGKLDEGETPLAAAIREWSLGLGVRIRSGIPFSSWQRSLAEGRFLWHLRLACDGACILSSR